MEIVREAAWLVFLSKEKQINMTGAKSLEFDEMFMNTDISYCITEESITARINLYPAPDNIEEAVKTINNTLDFGFFTSKNNQIIFIDSFFKVQSSKNSRMILMNHIQKFVKTLKKYLNVFKYFNTQKSKALQISSNLAKLIKEKYVSIVEYDSDKKDEFEEDIRIILRLIQADVSHLIIPQGSIIRPYRCIKFYLPRHQQALPFMNLSLMSQGYLNELLKVIDRLQNSGFVAKDFKRLRSCAYFLDGKVFIVPHVSISQLFHTKNAKLMNLQSLKEKTSIMSKVESFVDLKLLQNPDIFTVVKIEKKMEGRLMTVYKEMKVFKNDLIVDFYGIYTDGLSIFAVFEKNCPGNLAEYFNGILNSTQLKTFSQILVKILDFVEWIQDKPGKDMFLINHSKISFLDFKLKIFPSIQTIKDFSTYPPEDLLMIVLSKNQEFCEAFLDIIYYVQDDHYYGKLNLKLLGNALALHFKNGDYYSKNLRKMTQEVFGEKDKKKIIEINNLLNSFMKKLEEKIDHKHHSRFNQKHNFFSIILKYSVLKQLKKIIEFSKDSNLVKFIQDLENEDSSKHHSISNFSQTMNNLRLNVSNKKVKSHFSQSSTIDISQDLHYTSFYDQLESRYKEQLTTITDKIQKKFNQVIDENYAFKTSHLSDHKSFSADSSFDSSSSHSLIKTSGHGSEPLDFYTIQARASHLIEKYHHDFEEAKGFSENILNSQVIKLLKTQSTPDSSEIFMLGRLIFSVLFEEKDRKINEKLLSRRTNLHKYLKMTLGKRISFKVTEEESKYLPKYANLSLMMMNYMPYRRPSRKTILTKITRNVISKEIKSEIAPVKISEAKEASSLSSQQKK